MSLSKTIWANTHSYLRRTDCDTPVLFFAPNKLQDTARRFLDGFPGLVTYAVKANPDEEVIQNIATAGVSGFDVASPEEIALIRRLVPAAALHYNNPVRSVAEIDAGVAAGVASWSVDAQSELEKLFARLPAGKGEIAVRFKLPVKGASYDFGAKFGTTPDQAVVLLAQVAAQGFVPALTFHPGTQCTDPEAWSAYIREAAAIARRADVRIARLNVGGGFPSDRGDGASPLLETIFECIAVETQAAFGPDAPVLICEPGRAMVAESFTLAARVRAVRDGDHVFLNDGIYGALAEAPLVGLPGPVSVLAPDGTARRGLTVPRIVFGPTCDSVDRLPGQIGLPADISEGDYVLFRATGAYSTVTNTRFNGFGALKLVTVMSLEGGAG